MELTKVVGVSVEPPKTISELLVNPAPFAVSWKLGVPAPMVVGEIELNELLTNVNVIPLLGRPPTVTTTFPLVAPLGTTATMDVAAQLSIDAAVPLNVTVLVPCVAPKFKPVIVTDVPTGPDVGFKLEILGGTVNGTPLLEKPATVTTTFPVVAPLGTTATMDVALQLLIDAAVPLIVTVLAPCVAPKVVPVIVTDVPAAPEVGFKLAMCGVTLNGTPLLDRAPTVTTTLPVVAVAGTASTIDVALQPVIDVAGDPLKVTVLVPWVAPKFTPVIVTDVPTGPDVGLRLEMPGAAVMVNATPLLAKPPTVTTTLPVVAPVGTRTTIEVALQLVTEVAAVLLNVTALVPCVVPKFDPEIVTDDPTGPDVGLKPVTCGVTVKATPVLANPPTVTTTFPVVAPLGTTAIIEVALQLVTDVATVPLNATVLVPCVAPKFDPAIVTDVPTGPDFGFKLEILGGTTTVNGTPLLAAPPTVTTTFPVAAPVGTIATIEVALQLVTDVATVPLNATVLVPCVAPKFEPVIVTDDPTGPDVGLKPAICGVTVNATPVLAAPPTVTTTFPVVAPVGTAATIEVALQLVTDVATVPLNATVLVPCVAPKFEPVIVTDVPTGPEVGFKLEMLGGTTTVNGTPLLAAPPTVTTTLPVVAPVGTTATIEVALQLVTDVATVPLNVTVLVPCVAPKFEPVIVTDAPTGPEVGFKLEMAGDTVNADPLLATAPTVTTTFPLVAPAGTAATIEVAVQLVIEVAAVPLNVTVLVPWVAPKFDPVIVTDVPTGPEVGESCVIAAGLLIVSGIALDVPPPGAGFTTVTCAVPVLATSAAVTAALSWVPLMSVVETFDPFHCTCELDTNPPPLIVKLKAAAPATTLAGVVVEIVGTGLLVVII